MFWNKNNNNNNNKQVTTPKFIEEPKAHIFDMDDKSFEGLSMNGIASLITPPSGMKRGYILRLPNRKKFIYTGDKLVPIADDENIPKDFTLNEFPLNYWSGILSKKKKVYVNLSTYSIAHEGSNFRLTSYTYPSLNVNAPNDYMTWWKNTDYFIQISNDTVFPIEKLSIHKVKNFVTDFVSNVNFY